MLHQQLREATAALHERVERRLEIMDPHLTLPRYTRVLTVFYSVYRSLEEREERACADTPFVHFVAGRRKVPHLEADLAAMGLSATDLGAITPSTHLPELRTAESAVGALYVTEGATLGGQFIAKHVARVLGLTPATGLSFFTGDGPGIPAQWRVFRDLLATQPAAAAPSILSAAIATFTCFDNTFAEM